MAVAGPAMAAPFCFRSATIPPQCIYTDAALCNAMATQQGGVCMANPDEVNDSGGAGHFCVMTSGRVSSCVYSNPETCRAAALRQQGACVEAPNWLGGPLPDAAGNPPSMRK